MRTTIDVTAPTLTTFSLNRQRLATAGSIRPVVVSRASLGASLAEIGGASGGGSPPACTCGAHGPADRLMNTKEAAAYLGVSPEYLEKLRTYGLKRGTPPKFSRIGRRVIYTKAELDAYVERNSAQTTSEYDPNA